MKGDITQRAARIAAEAVITKGIQNGGLPFGSDAKVWQAGGRHIIGFRKTRRLFTLGIGNSWREAVADAQKKIKPKTRNPN